MAKLTRKIDDIKFDTSFDPKAATSKLPGDLVSVEVIKDFINVPVTQLIEYQNKRDSDFRPWPQEKFNLFVENVRTLGIIEPITVRPTSNEGFFEILAGEHRWKAGREAGFRVVPVHVIKDCDDEKAAMIFSVTNVLRRDNTLKDRVNAWWHYTNQIRYKGRDGIEDLVRQGVIPAEVYEQAQGGIRTVYRLARLHNLIDELLDFADQKKLNVVAAEQLSFLSPAQQTDLLPYKHSLNDNSKATRLHNLADGSIDGKEWSDETIKEILFPPIPPKANTLREISDKVKGIISDRMDKSAYSQVEEIVSAAIDQFLEEHPEYRKKTK